jgi:hypothetical protein
MEMQLFVTLMSSAIGFAGQVLSSVIAKLKGATSEQASISNQMVIGFDSQQFDKTFLEGVIKDSTTKIAELLEATSNDLKQEMREQRVREAVQDVQAHVAALRQLLSLREMNPQLAIQLVVSALNPLQVSLEIAKLRLRDHDKEAVWQYCYVIGTSALIAGYAYLGQDMPSLREDLEETIRQVQVRMLDSIAQLMIPAKMNIPWGQVSRLMTVDGISELSELYYVTAQSVNKENSQATPNTLAAMGGPYVPSVKPVRSVKQEEGPTHVSKTFNAFSGSATCSSCGKNVKLNATACPNCHSIFTNP